MKNFTQVLSIICIILVLCTCKKEQEIPSVNDIEISKTAVVANSTSIKNLLSFDSLSLTFNSSASQISQLTPGSILIIEKGEGLLRKVKSVQNVGGNLKVTTENARLDEVIIHGVVESEITLDPEKVISYKFSDDRISFGKGGKYSLVFNKFIVGVSQGSNITIDGGTQFDPPKIKIKAYFNNGLDSLNASLEINATTSFKLTADGGITGGYKKSPPLAEYTFSPISIFVGPVPVLITPKIQINIGANASISGKMEAGFESATTIVGGIKYKNGVVGTYSSISQSVTNPNISLAAKGSIEGYIMVPKLGFYFYSLAGPFVDLKLYGTLKDITTTTAGLYFGVKGEGGFETDILSMFNFPNLQWKKEFPIYEKEVFSITNSAKPTITTSQPTSITSTSTTVGGNLSSDGGSPVTERGVYWGTSQNPETSGTKLQIGSGTGSFSTSLSGLNPNTTYYIKAYAINSQGTAYGTQTSFTTSQNITIPTVSTTAITTFTSTSATVGGNVTSDGNATVTERGIYYGTSANPETTGTKLQIGSGTGLFSTTLTGLNSNTTYYVKAYAINSQGTAYGTQVSFTTSDVINTPPSVPSNPSPSNMATTVSTSPTLSWTCSDPNGDALTYDIYFGTSSNLTAIIASNQIATSINRSNLNSSTTYYWKVVAKDSKGAITEGPVWNFSTQSGSGSNLNWEKVGTGIVTYSGSSIYIEGDNYPAGESSFHQLQSQLSTLQNNVFQLSFDWTIKKQSDQSAVWIQDSNGNNLIEITDYSNVIGFYTPTTIAYCNNITFDKIYNIKAVINLTTKKADYYIDGVLAQSGLDLRSGDIVYTNSVRIKLCAWIGDAFIIDNLNITY